MWKNLCLLSLFILVFVMPLSAQEYHEWSFNIDSSAFWGPGYTGGFYLIVNKPFALEIKFQNHMDNAGLGGTASFELYGTGDLTHIDYVVIPHSGFTPFSDPSVAVGNWVNSEAGLILSQTSWDGVLPDTFSVSLLSFVGVFPTSMLEAETAFEVYMLIPTYIGNEDMYPGEGLGELCIDSINHPSYEWLFIEPSIVNGPKCWPTVVLPCGVVEFTDAPDTVYYDPVDGFNTTLEYTEWGCCSPTIVLDDLGSTEILFDDGSCNGELTWSFNPELPFVDWPNGDNEVVINPCGGWGCGMGHTITLIIPSDPPAFQNGCGNTIYTESGEAYDYQLLASDPEEVGIMKWYVSSNPEPAGSYSVSEEGLLSFTPSSSDVGSEFLFTVSAKDFGGNKSSCTMAVKVFDSPICGDFNFDGGQDVLDIIFFINNLYKDGPPPSSDWIADVNGDGDVNILDILYYIEYKFKGGNPPNCM